MTTHYGWESELPALASMTAEQAAATIKAMTVNELPPAGTMVTLRVMVQVFPNPLDGQRFLEKLQTIAALTRPTDDSDASVMLRIVQNGITWMDPTKTTDPGIDIGDPTVRGLLTSLVGQFNITQAEVNAMLAYKCTTQHKYPQGAAPAQVNAARGQ